MKNKTLIAMLIGAVVALALTVVILIFTAKTVHTEVPSGAVQNSFITHSAVATASAGPAPTTLEQPRMVKVFEVSSQIGIYG